MASKLTKGILVVLFANVFNLVISMLTNLVLPKNLSVETYAAIKTYQLYLSYVGILHFGFIDGIYLKFGGKNLKTLNWDEVRLDISSFRIFQFIIMILGLIVALALNDFVLAIVFIMIIPTNMLNFFKYLFQAVGEFTAYSRITNIVTTVTFLLNMILVLIFQSDNYAWYLIGYAILNIIIWVAVELFFVKRTRAINFSGERRQYFSLKELQKEINAGILLTLGNFSSILMNTLDRWFVRLFINMVAFAQYSFAVSMEGFLNTAITPVSITLYNSFCIDSRKEKVELYRKMVALFGVVVVAAAFPVKFILETYLKKYLAASNIVFLLFSAQIFYVIIKSIYVNLYKARKEQKQYFIKLIASLVAGLVFNIISYFIYNKMEGYAVATVLSSIFWLIIVQFDFKENRVSTEEWLFLITEFIVFIITGFYLNSILGFLVYMISVVISLFIFMRKVLFQVLEIISTFFHKVVR